MVLAISSFGIDLEFLLSQYNRLLKIYIYVIT